MLRKDPELRPTLDDILHREIMASIRDSERGIEFIAPIGEGKSADVTIMTLRRTQTRTSRNATTEEKEDQAEFYRSYSYSADRIRTS